MAQALQHHLSHEIDWSCLSSEELELLCSLPNEHFYPTNSLASGCPCILQDSINIITRPTWLHALVIY